MTIPLLLILSLLPGPDSTAQLLDYHLQRYPKLQVQDVYKMLYQGEFGIGHLLGDGSHARTYLLEELAGLESVPTTEDLLEPVSPDGGMVRVNLRPFKRIGYTPELLLRAMLATASRTHGDTARFLATWHSFVEYAGEASFHTEEVREWDRRVAGRDLRVAHHSAAYEAAYHPAYRVCRREVIEALLAEERRREP